MEAAARDDVTRWLRAWSAGDESALEKLIPLVYGELRLRARRLMGREREGHSLRPTATALFLERAADMAVAVRPIR
jgi:hypothetical protein